MKYQKVIETNKELMPKGQRSGDISYDHQRLEQLDDLRSIKEIAYLFQNPSAQMAMHPKVLILDEPTAQLDPTVRNDFLVMLQKLHKEFGLTIILTSHNLEDVMEMADQCIIHLNSHFHRFFVWKINLTQNQALRQKKQGSR